MNSSTFCRSDDGTHVADIGDMVQQQDERHNTLIFQRLNNISKSMIPNRRDSGNNTLMISGSEPVEFLDRHHLEREVAFTNGSTQFLEKRTVYSRLNKQLFYLSISLYGFQDRTHAKDKLLPVGRTMFHVKRLVLILFTITFFGT